MVLGVSKDGHKDTLNDKPDLKCLTTTAGCAELINQLNNNYQH